METKDLVLLMMIPVILIGLVVYTQNAPTITGAVISQEKQSNIIGNYSINPSFRAKVDYDLNDFTKIKQLLGFVSECSKNNGNVESCMKQAEGKDSNFEWALGCDKGTEKILYDFAEFYQGCFDSDDSNCLCTKNMELTKDEIEKYELANKIYRMGLFQDIQLQKVNIKMIEPNIDLSYDIKLSGRSVWYPVEYVIGYSQNNLFALNIKFIDEITGDPYYFTQRKDIILYKNEINGIKSVDFADKEEEELIYPNKKRIKPESLHPCDLKPKNTYRFCVTKKDSKVMAYDRIDNQVKERNVVIKFASYIPTLPPPPITNVQVYNKPKADKSLLIKWDKISGKDILKYRIYYSDSSLNLLEKTSIENLRKNKNVFEKEINPNKIEIKELNDMDITKCDFDYLNKKCMFTAGGEKISIDTDKLYYMKSSDSFIYKLIVPENYKTYDIAVTAVDKNNNEIDNIEEKQKLPIVKSKQSVDDLPPDSDNLVIVRLQQIYDQTTKKVTFTFADMPTTNIDGSILNDFKNYRIYFKKYPSLALQEKSDAINSIMNGELNKLQLIGNVDYTRKGSSLVSDITKTNPEKDNIYFFMIVAFDNSGNPKEDQFKVMEIGAVPLQLTIP